MPQVSPDSASLTISTTSISKGVSNRLYPAQTLAATGGTTPYTWSSSNLPPGLTLTPDGKLSGIPTFSAGSYDFYVTVTDNTNQTAQQPLTLALVAPLTIKTTTLPDAISNKAYSALMSATGGDPPTSQWAATSGSLPDGFALDANTGTITRQATASPGTDTISSFSITLTSDVAGISLSCENSFTIKTEAVF